VLASVTRDHACHGGVKHGGTNCPRCYAEKQDGIGGYQADQADEEGCQKRTAQDEDAGTVAVRIISDEGLDDEGHDLDNSGDKTNLDKGKGEALLEDRQEGIDEGCVEIAAEMNQGEGEDDFRIRSVVFRHAGRFRCSVHRPRHPVEERPRFNAASLLDLSFSSDYLKNPVKV